MTRAATQAEKAAFVDRISELYRLFSQEGGREPQQVLRDIQAASEGRSSEQPTAVSDPVEQAIDIMGSNFIGPEEVKQRSGLRFTAGQYKKLLTTMPFSADVLRSVRDTHVLIAVPAVSLMDLQGKLNNLFYSKRSPWYANESFAQTKLKAGWQLVRKTEVPNSRSKTWSEQQALLTEELVPGSALVALTALMFHLERGERLFTDYYVRTSDVYSDGYRVFVGHFDADGLYVYICWDDGHRDYLGLSSARKFS